MGCESYKANNAQIRFSEMDDAGCLCTFPHNDFGTLKPDRVRQLAYLGAAVMLAHREPENGLSIRHYYIPHMLPKNWVADIDKCIPELGDSEKIEDKIDA